MKKILIIEDNAEIRDNIFEMLELEGFAVHLADNGHSGLEAAHTIIPDVILCDIMMPGLNGYEVLQKLKKIQHLSEIPLIVLSAQTESKDLQKAMDMGAFSYIRKPFESEELLMQLRKAIDCTG